MKNEKLILICLIFFLFLHQLRNAWALDLEFEYNARFLSFVSREKNFLNTDILYNKDEQKWNTDDYLSLMKKDFYPSFILRTGGGITIEDTFSLNILLDSGEIRRSKLPLYATTKQDIPIPTTDTETKWTSSGYEFADMARDIRFIKELHGTASILSNGWITISGGKKYFDIGNDLVFNDLGLGAEIDLDLDVLQGIPFKGGAKFIIPGRKLFPDETESYIYSMKIEYAPGLVQNVGLFFTYFHDGTDELGEIMSANMVEATAVKQNNKLVGLSLITTVYSRGDIFYAGTYGELEPFEWLSLSGVFITQFGNFHLDYDLLTGEKRALKATLLGFGMDFDADFRIGDFLELTMFFLYLSGDDRESKQEEKSENKVKLQTFISLVPYITRSNIFFSGGLNESIAARKISTSGVNARGVLAPGIWIDLYPMEELSLKFKEVFLFADVRGPYSSSRFYGFESDFEISYEVFSFLDVMAEADFLVPGSFFKEKNMISKIMAGINLHYEK
jgi:hypothetical protein